MKSLSFPVLGGFVDADDVVAVDAALLSAAVVAVNYAEVTIKESEGVLKSPIPKSESVRNQVRDNLLTLYNDFVDTVKSCYDNIDDIKLLLCIHICCIPECKSNYVSSLKESNNKCETAFSFPKCSQRLMKWLNVIPRKNWTPSKTSVRNKKVPLAYPKLSENAIPRNFPNLPKYLPSDSPRIRADPEKRRENLLERDKKVLDDFLSEDVIQNFEVLLKNFTTSAQLEHQSLPGLL
nr:unnamed protein product [Callosobruchus analis]